MGVLRLTEIQARAFEPILRGRSFAGRSRTGTGKTVAYLLPLLERVRQEKLEHSHALLVLLPTRELCRQVAATILALSVSTDVALLIGGATLDAQEKMLRAGVDVVIGTPGRVARLLERGALEAAKIRSVVVDEADVMLGAEYVGRVRRIFEAVAKPHVQGVLFSASMPHVVTTEFSRYFPDYDLVDIVDRGGLRGTATVEEVVHCLCVVPQDLNGRLRVLLHLLAQQLDERGGQCLVFVDSKREAKLVLTHPVLDVRARALHSDASAAEREAALAAFERRAFDVLVTTDIVSRGVDFDNVNVVLQLHPPTEGTQYVHRAGRTGRAGRAGVCITLYDASEHALIKAVREVTQQRFKVLPTPSPSDIHHAAVNRLLDDLLAVQPEEYEPVLPHAEAVLEAQGPTALASALAVLDGRHADLTRLAKDRPSLLSGRPGYVCLLAQDPDHSIIENEESLRRLLRSLLPARAAGEDGEQALGRVARTSEGWAIDVAQRWAPGIISDVRTGRRDAPFELIAARQLPRLARAAAATSRRARRLPWASQRKSAFRRRRRGGAPPSRPSRRGILSGERSR
eukprot:TRINITY_DN54164_c0_g1_i1.p1 TRINITY_DN54164_c0_g1~~TRINITY_DN54164_c0_g1_i1.p1  ORF type:complete len:641 (-),score=141.00 TRINITY_DN54164_c0_g1_i1:5-1717(-)